MKKERPGVKFKVCSAIEKVLVKGPDGEVEQVLLKAGATPEENIYEVDYVKGHGRDGEIAKQLGVTRQTVAYQRDKVFGKLKRKTTNGARNPAAAAAELDEIRNRLALLEQDHARLVGDMLRRVEALEKFSPKFERLV